MGGTTLGPYRIIVPLGAGGMGEVYRAYDSRLQRDVAVKLLPAASAENDDARARLLREARAAAALNHPHICTIYEVGEADGQAYIAMELVDGRTLDHVIPPDGLDAATVYDYGQQIAEAVSHAHAKGVLHRDLKTANIMVTADGRVKVLDFGLAKRTARQDGPDLTTEGNSFVGQHGQVAGTLAYMSPEQLRGEPASAASDVWALGVVLHEMAAGERPFAGNNAFEMAAAILGQSPRALQQHVPTILRGIVSRCLAKQPRTRYQNAGELRAALDAARAGYKPLQHPSLASSAGVEVGEAAVVPAAVANARLITGLTLAVLVVLVAAFVITRGVRAPAGSPAEAPRVDSIAVLPLENLSGNADEEYFAAGMQDGLITELAQLRSIDRVIERRSTLRFAGTKMSVPEVAKALGVDAVVTGSVLRAGERVQVTARLIDAASERHLWADRFERDAHDVLSIQSDVAQAVAAALGAELTPQQRQRWTSARPVDPSTYEAYLRGMHLVSRGTGTRADRVRGLAILHQAVDRDAGNAHAYAGLALGYVTLGHGPQAEDDAWPKARAAAVRAITLDPSLAEAHSALAEVRQYYERDWAGAEESFRRAMELNPNLAMNHYHYAWYLALFGRWNEAIAEHERAQELDPLTPQHSAHLGTIYLYRGRLDEAIAEAKKTLEFAPNAPVAWSVLGRGLQLQGRSADAEAALEKANAISPSLTSYELGTAYAAAGKIDKARAIAAAIEAQPSTPWHVWSLSQLYVALGDYDRAFEWLEHRPAHAFLPWARVNPAYAPIWKDPRFAKLMAELRLPLPQ